MTNEISFQRTSDLALAPLVSGVFWLGLAVAFNAVGTLIFWFGTVAIGLWVVTVLRRGSEAIGVDEHNLVIDFVDTVWRIPKHDIASVCVDYSMAKGDVVTAIPVIHIDLTNGESKRASMEALREVQNQEKINGFLSTALPSIKVERRTFGPDDLEQLARNQTEPNT